MNASRVIKGIVNSRLTPCVIRHSEILRFTPVTHLMKVRHKVHGKNYRIEPTTPKPVAPKKTTKAESQNRSSIWLKDPEYVPQYTIEEAITMHMEYADPSMLDNMEGCIYVNVDTDMSTKKKTKFLKNVKGILEYPNYFQYGRPKKIAVFCFKPEDVEIAKSYGISYFGGEDLIREICGGLISREVVADLDFILATTDNPSAIASLRPTLRERMPKLGNNTMHEDISFLLEKHTKSVMFNVTKTSEEKGKTQIPIGKMSQGLPSLVENFDYLVNHLLGLKGRAKNVVPFIDNMTVIAPPSQEQFNLKREDYIPGLKQEKQEKVAEKIDEGEEEMEDEEAVQAAR